MRDSPLPAPAYRRPLPDSVCVPPGRAIWSLLPALCLLAGLFFSAGAQAQTPTLTVSPTTSTDGAYTVSWSKPATSSVKIRLHEQAGSGAWSVVGTYTSTVTSKSFTGKAAGTYRYKTERCITVFSSTSCQDAAGPVSVTVSATPTQASPPDAPAKPTVSAGNTYLSVSWTAPDDNGSPITRYSMHYKAGASGAWTTHPLANAGTATRTTITGLTNGTTYRIQVRAHNAGGISAFSATARGTPTGAGTLTVSPTTSTDGSYTVTWSKPATASIRTQLFERVGSGDWSQVGTGTYYWTTTARSFTGKAAGTYSYKTSQCVTVFSSTSCWDAAGPVSVTVTRPKPTATMSWSPASVAYGGSSTLSWSSTHATACYLNGVKRATRGAWLAKDHTATRTDNVYCTGPGGTSATVPATLMVEAPPPDLPAAPAKPALTGGVLRFTANWTAPNDNGSAITDYTLQYRLGAGAWQRTTTGSTATRATVTVPSAGTYTVHVRAKNTAGWSKFSPGATVEVKPRSAPPPAVPATPTGPATSTGTHTVTWVKVTGATRYRVRESDDNGKTWTVSDYQDTLSRTFKDRNAGAWDYQVQACTDTDGQCSAWSATLTITAAGPITLRITPDPSPDGEYTVSWTPPVHTAVTLRLWQQVEKGGKKQSWTVVGTYAGTTTSKAFSQGSTPATYHYKAEHCITVFRAQACWGESDSISVTVGAAPPTPAIPTGLTNTAADARGNYTVSWATVTGVTRYELRERDDEDEDWDNDYTINTGTSQAFSDKDPKTWTYQVRACNSAAATPCSDWSVSLDVPVPKLAAPTNLTHTTPTTAGNYTVSWDAVTHATRYELRESDDDGKTWDTTHPIASGTKQDFTNKPKGAWTYQVRACRVRATTCGEWSSPVGVPVSTLPPPENVTATTPDVRGNYTLSWDIVTSATHYQVRESEDDKRTWPQDYTVNSGRQLAFTDKTPGTRHYQVRACDADTCSPWHRPVVSVTVPRLAPPDNLAHTAPDANGDYTVNWDAVTHATRYELKESDDGGKTWDTTYPIPAGTSKALVGKTPGIRDYQARACRVAAATCSEWSDTLPVTVPPPGVPENLTATTPDANGDYTVSWDAVPHVARYQLQESDDGGSTWDTTYPIPAGASKAITGKTPGTWTYQARACRVAAATCSEWSDTLPVIVPGPPGQPDAPTLTPGDTRLSVTWTAPDDNGSALTGYNVRYQADTDTDWTSHTHMGTDTESVIRNLTNGTEYAVQVQAVNARGESPWSEGATATPAAFLTPPAGLTAPMVSDGNHTVRWQPSPGATCYVLAASDDGGQTWTTHQIGKDTYHKDFSAVPLGTWTYRVRACAGMQVGNWSRTITVTVGQGSIPAPPGPKTPTDTEVISQAAQTNSDKVGTLPGSFRVTEQGSASYRIDLALPPGSGGVVPPLALAYDSQRGNGLLGIGWAIEGLSGITRCRQTLSQDGAAQPLTFSKADRFCLDGQRLLLSDSTNNKNREYGDPGTEYQTEIDSFLTVTAHDGTAGHPDYFEVKRKDGSTATYGAKGAHAAEHKLYKDSSDKTGNILTWALQTVKDSVGNKITYHYTLDKNGQRLTHIRYAYGASKTAYQAEVVLAYEGRKDPTTGYLVGRPVQSTQRLQRITLRSAPGQGGLKTLYNYRLRYRDVSTGTVDSLSRLVSVQGCVGAGESVCQPKTQFTWSDPKAGFKDSAKSLTLNAEKAWSPVDFNPADINGDGHSDLVWTETKGSKHRLRYALANKATSQLEVARFMGGATTLEYDDKYGTSPYGYNLRVHTEVVDYNADGRHDLLVYSDETKQTTLHLAVPQSTGGWLLSAGTDAADAVLSGRYRYADINSDGLLDAYKLVVDKRSPHDDRVPTKYGLEVRYLKPATGQQPSSSRYYAFAPAETLPVPFDQLDPDPPLPGSPASTPPTFNQWRALLQSDVALADVDGDGRADLIAWERDWFDIFELTASGARIKVFRQVGGNEDEALAFEHYGDEAGIPAVRTGYSPRGLRVQDINQDGLSDLVYFRGSFKKVKGEQRWFGDWQYRLSTGTGWADAVILLKGASTTPAPSSLSLYDDNSDGYPDVLWHDVKAKRLKLKRYRPELGAFAADKDVTTVYTTEGKDEEQYFSADVSGDGHSDLLYVADTGNTETLKTHLHNTQSRPHLITAITNGLGAKTTLTYESLSRTEAYVRIEGISTTPVMKPPCVRCWYQPVTVANADAFYTQLNTPWTDTHHTLAATSTAPVLELMAPLYVVTQVQSSAPTGTDANATSGIGYVYEQGKIQAAGRGLLGFKALTTLDLQTGVATTTTYRQDFPYIGYPQTTEVRTKENKLLRKAVNTWHLQGYQDDDPTTPDEDEGWDALVAEQGSVVLGALQPYLARTRERTCSLAGTQAQTQACSLADEEEEEEDEKKDEEEDEAAIGDALHTVTTENTYDDWGNPTEIMVTTDDHVNGKQFRQVTENTYGSTDDSKRLGRLTETTVTRHRDVNGDGDTGDEKETLTRKSAFSYYTSGKAEDLLKSETLSPDDTALEHETTYHYDAFGNRVRAVVKAGGETRCNTRDTAQYDSTGRYRVKEWDCLGRPRRALSGHNGWGQPATVKQFLDTDEDENDSNNPARTTTHTTTPGGWLAVSRESTGAHTGQVRAKCTAGVTHCPTGAAYYIETRQAGGGKQWQYRDTLDRVTRTRADGFKQDTWILTDTEYDSLGRVARQSTPYHAGKTAYWTTTTYDLLGRVVKTTLPDYATDSNAAVTHNSVITMAYTGFTTTTTNGEGQKHTKTRNALGEVIRSTDDAGTPVTHTYDAWGQVIETATGAGTKPVRVQWTYDARGRRTGVSDPDWKPKADATRTTYTYNGFDELIKQTDRIGNEQAMTYDGLGRLLTRKDYAPDGSDSDYDPDLTAAATWTYDGAGNGLGQVQTVTDTKSGYARTHEYDTAGRESITTLTVETGQYVSRKQTYHTQQTYDAWGRPYQFFDARLETDRPEDQFTDNVTEVHYNERGYASLWTDGVYVSGKPRRTYREITAVDARGQVTGETLGGGVISTRRSHDVKTGRITGITHQDALPREVQADTYGWDVLGNLSSRTAVRGHHTVAESFEYDTLNRLTEASAVHTKVDPMTQAKTTRTHTPQKVTYDALGNITSKSGVGAYSYDTRHPYAVSKTETTDNKTTPYFYDAMGNQVFGAGRTLDYTPFHKVKSIQKGIRQEVQFVYGPDRSRITRTDINQHNKGSSTTTTVYAGNVEHVIAQDGSSTYKRYLAGGTVLITQDYDRLADRTGEDTCYLLKDHLGSLTTVLNKHGSLLQSFSYDAWGQRRNPDTAAMLASLTLSSPIHSHTTTRGYTGHEMLDAMGIIHMNGRLYDPRLGRFLQADPVIQFPHYTQSWNTYSYVLNNPLTYTDPTGYFIPVFAALAAGISIGLKVKLVTAAILIGTGVFADSLAQGAPLDKAFLAGVSAAALTYVAGATFPQGGLGLNAATYKHLATVSIVGGITTSLQGGKFGHGFLSAGLGAASGGIPGLGEITRDSLVGRTLVSAVVGGTISEVTGGKFANGAMTAAFVSLVSSTAGKASELSIPIRQKAGDVYGHGVYGIGKHGSVRFYPDDPNAINAYLKENGFSQVLQVDEAGRQYIVFSGGPDFDGPGLLGNLRGDINRPLDLAAAPNDLVGGVYVPAGVSKDTFIKQLITNTGTYNTNPVNYDLLPSFSSGYNSNSYFRGLVNSAGGRIQGNINWQYQGFSKPVPKDRF